MIGDPEGAPAPTSRRLPPAAYLLLPWALYVALTTVIFHVELRYRLPLYPALLPYAGLALAGGRWQVAGGRGRALAMIAPAACLALTLLHASYPALAWQLGQKHWQLARAEAALSAGDLDAARRAADSALARDENSALARVALARADLLAGDLAGGRAQLDAAVEALPAHPYAHLLRGDLLRRQGDGQAAGADLAYEASSLEDLQTWSWDRFATPPPARLDLGAGLDLGFIQGFHGVAAGERGFRWTRGAALLRVAVPPGGTTLRLRAASGRPDGSPVALRVTIDGRDMGAIEVAAGWAEYSLELPRTVPAGQAVRVALSSATFTPRAYERASPDGRRLGVRLAMAEVVPAP